MGYLAEEHERGLAAFIVPQRRERFVAALEKGGKARSKELARLHETPDLDQRWVRPLPDLRQGTSQDAMLLSALHDLAPGVSGGYLVSREPELDGRFLEVADALEACAWTGEGVLVSVLPGRVAIYVGELVDSARLLNRVALGR